MASQVSALWRYLAVAFVVSWVFWIPVTLATYGLPSFADPFPANWFNDFLSGGPLTSSHWLVLAGGVLGPLAGAFAGWSHLAGDTGRRALVLHLFNWRLSDIRGWLTAFIPLVIFGVASLAVWLMSGAVIGISVPLGTYAAGFIAGMFLIAGEELGWRGTQLPLLQERHSALVASIIVGVTWALWHIPLLLMGSAREGDDASFMAINLVSAMVPYLLMTIPLTIAHTFAFNSARGLILVPIIAHSLSNALNADTGPVLGTEEQVATAGGLAGPLLMAAFWIVGIGLWLIFKGRSLSWRDKVTATSMLERVEQR